MPESIFIYILGFVAVYLFLGIVFAWVFGRRRMGAMDPAAEKGTWGFRLLILPGMAVLWPLFFYPDFVKRTSHSGVTALRLRSKHRMAIMVLAVMAALIFITALVWRTPNFEEFPSIEIQLP